MEEQKKFQKKSLNSDDYKGTEKGAKAVKGFFGILGAIVLIAVNKDNLKALESEAQDITKKIVKNKEHRYG